MLTHKKSQVSYPRAVIHVDGDAFFVGCEVAKRPWLKGKPVVTGAERGIASALSYEAKARGVSRGMKMSDVRKICPEVTIFPGDYETYEMYSERMVNIVRRYTPYVEPYSIDECFADITNATVIPLKKGIQVDASLDPRIREDDRGYEEIARRIKHDLDNELGMTFSVGLSVNKVLAKCASKWQKPSGLTFIPFEKINEYLAKIPVGKIWGIGGSTSISLGKHKIYLALSLAEKSYEWVSAFFSKPLHELRRELRGEFIYPLNSGEREVQKSIMKTRTFRPPSQNKSFTFAELSKNVEEASRRLRALGLCTRDFSFFLKTQEFKYHSMSLKLDLESSVPQEFLKEIEKHFNKVFQPNILYRTTGIRFFNLLPVRDVTPDLFGKVNEEKNISKIYETVDKLSRKFGDHAVFLAASFRSRINDPHKTRHFSIPSLGEVM